MRDVTSTALVKKSLVRDKGILRNVCLATEVKQLGEEGRLSGGKKGEMEVRGGRGREEEEEDKYRTKCEGQSGKGRGKRKKRCK